MTWRGPCVGRSALRNNLPLCLQDHVLFRITACATAVIVCIFDILTDTEQEQVFCVSTTILFCPSCGKRVLKKAVRGCHCITQISPFSPAGFSPFHFPTALLRSGTFCLECCLPGADLFYIGGLFIVSFN